MQPSGHFKVHYFAGYGRAEAVRMLLTHAKVAYEDVNYGEGHNSWPEAKASGKLSQSMLAAFEK